MTKPTIAITIGQEHYPRMMSQAAWDALESFAEIIHHPKPEPASEEDLILLLPEADACITSWGVAQLNESVLEAAPRLRAMAHMGGSIKRFVSDAFWGRDLHLTSASVTLARDVAETTLGLMIVGQKRIFPLGQHVREGGWRGAAAWEKWSSRELYQKNVGIIGASTVGRHVIKLLQPFEPHILLYDPFVSGAEARQLGVTLLELEELLARADVLSLHAPSVPATHRMLNAERLALMKDDALIINTARGTLIDEAALVRELSAGRFFAFLDVTDPEPPVPDSPLRRLDNVIVTPHIAGCIENCTRMGELAVEELRRFFAGEPAINRITREELDRIA